MENFYSLVIIFVMMLVSYITALTLSKLKYFDFLFLREGRYGAIDGLRGYLALFVFIHHFIITWYWHNTGKWARPPEESFQNIGKIGVMIFFMITGFLFISKIISDQGKTDWYRLYRSRVFRIYPLYLFILLIVSIIVFYKTNFHLNVELFQLLKEYTRWFIYYGGTINDFSSTKIIIASVDWTLKYEWIFYVSLPFIAWAITKNKFEIFSFLIALMVISYLEFSYYGIHTMYFIFFIIGGIVAYMNSIKPLLLSYTINKHFCSIIITILFFVSVFYLDTYSYLQIASISIFFTAIVFGNTMFGLLKSKASIFLGEISYGIYLLHGAILYILFSLVNVLNLTQVSLKEYEYSMPIITIVIIVLSTLTYITIERPGIKYGKR